MPTRTLETADHPETLRRVAIDAVTRVEGHGKVTLLLDADNRVRQARFHIGEFRGFERFIEGRPYWEVPVMVQRLCGICPVSHHLAASKALDAVVGATQVTHTADAVRRLMHYGQVLQSHALHFFYLASPDLLFGFDSEPARRSVVGVIEAYPGLALQGVKLRKFGQEVIRLTAGKRIHGTGSVPGGVNRTVSREERAELRRGLADVIAWAREGVALVRRLHEENRALYDTFGAVPSNVLSLVRPDGGLELYDGVLRARRPDATILFDGVPAKELRTRIREEVRAWSYMKFPYLTELGPEEGWYRVGPLARVFNCDFIPTPLAEAERRILRGLYGGAMVHAPLVGHHARMIELLHCAERIGEILADDALSEGGLVTTGPRGTGGVAVIEAPRGTLLHHYEVGPDDLVTRCNLVVSTTHNNQAMNEAIRRVALDVLDGQEPTEGLLNHVEVAIRAFDPCLSCATHALGQMPLVVEWEGPRGAGRVGRDADGRAWVSAGQGG